MTTRTEGRRKPPYCRTVIAHSIRRVLAPEAVLREPHVETTSGGVTKAFGGTVVSL